MNAEELAFANKQLAGMLKSGIPLEGALRQLCVNMRGGRLRIELEALESELAKGIPLREALSTRKLPEFYIKMLQLGAQTDLTGVLLLVADYYQRASLVGRRLKGLMIYPLIVLTVSLGLAGFVAFVCTRLMAETTGPLSDSWWPGANTGHELTTMLVGMWTPVGALLFLTLLVTGMLLVPSVRRTLRWWLPGFRENSLSNFAATMNLMLRSGGYLAEALDLAQDPETGTPAGA